MGKVKVSFERVSLNQLCTLTGKQSRTLKKLLADTPPIEGEGSALLYIPSDVLPIIYGVRQAPSDEPTFAEGLNPLQEKARLDKLKADKVEIEIAVMKGKLIPADRVEMSWSKLVSAFRSKILNMPSKISPRICAVKDIKEVEKILKAECNEALTELSEYGNGIDRPRNSAKGS
jgi:phage terminase Nu1 subunit (DNA packaging protein)